MTIEDRLRAAMRAHDHEAPVTVPGPGPTPAPTHPRRLATAGVMLVAVLLAAGVVAVVWPRQARPAAAAPLSCPPSSTATAAAPTVPELPTVPDGSTRLVPDATPLAVLVCGYTSTDPAARPPIGLTGSATLGGDLQPVAAALRDLPRQDQTGPVACAGVGTSRDADSYLLGLTYADGTVWVSAPDGGGCPGSSNGPFTTPTSVAADAAASLAAGRWVTAGTSGGASTTSTPTAAGCPGLPAGRLGDDTALVPGDPTTLAVCVGHQGDPRVRTVTADPQDVRDLAAALNALPTSPTTDSCRQNGGDTDFYVLSFGYADGPESGVQVWAGCDPQVWGGRLQAADASTVLPLLVALTS